MKLPKPQEGFAQYQGAFSSPAFSLLAGNPLFHANLFRALATYGATPQNLKTEGSAGTIAVGYDVFVPHNFVVRLKLDTIDVTFYSLQAIGNERAKQVVIDLWDAIKNSDNSVELTQHIVTTAYQFEMGVGAYKQVLQPYVKIPESLGSEIEPGVVFYSPGGHTLGDKGATVVLDRLAPGKLNLRIVMVIDAKKVPLSTLGTYVEEYVNSSFSMLGLEIERDN